MRKIAIFNPLRFFDLENTVSVFKYGSTIRSNVAFNTRIHDFIVVIDEGLEKAIKWHQTMMTDYPYHYSRISILGPKFISKFQRYSKLCPIFYNSCVIKYGVISKDDLADSLINWTSPFVLSRFQKMIFPVGVIDTYLQSLISQCDSQTTRLFLLSLCEDDIFYRIKCNHNLKNSLINFNNQERKVSLLEFLRKIVNSSYAGDIRFLFNDNSIKLSEKELYDSLPFLTARYLPSIIHYFQNNKSGFAIEGASLSTLNELCKLAKSITDKMACNLMNNPMSGMNSEFCVSEDWSSFIKLFFNERITLKINPSREWRANEFLKLPNEFKSRASRIAARKRFLKLLPINILFSKYIDSLHPSTLPWSPNVIDETIRRYNFKCSLLSVLKNILFNFGRIVSNTLL
ncbi:Mitochondrial matrix Mmp37 family protein [Cryptosporidium meleagridis]|uniref:Phosphatidate cytidylyltransferase, mitochondrial n=1 Tax=Cryptosporidium meleagridis TaxID=93969 RepID=A0A2P4Z5P3_9CRYT|nr:Mitochondrial matrix Mmp37 family protein [Cryptosporidium meleagridis]